MKGRTRGAVAAGAAIQLALAMIGDGRARSKRHAAQLAGIDEGMLKPQELRRFAAKNPVGRRLAQMTPNLLAITAEVNGKRVSAGEALVSGVETAIAILAKLGPRLDKLTKHEDARFQRAKRWLELSRSCGLFAPSPQSALPSEIAGDSANSTPEGDPVPGSLGEFVDADHPPVEGEDTAQSCKVEA